MRYLFLTMGYPSKKNPNAIVFLQRLVHELVDQGHEATVICPIKYQDAKGMDTTEVHHTKNGGTVQVYFPRFLAASLESKCKHDMLRNISVNNFHRAVLNTIKKNGIAFDCVYSHFLWVSMLAAVLVGERYHKPVFAAAGESHFRCFESKDSEKIFEGLSKLNGIISVSSDNKKLLLERNVLDDDRICIYPNGIDSTTFYPRDKAACRQKFGFAEEDFIVAFTGHFIERKGPLRLLAAAKDLPVKLAFAGKGEQKPEGDNIIWCQPVKPDDMGEFLCAADLFVLPTLNEGCCNAIIEAMACGLPVVSANRPFNDDILDESCSILVNPESVEEIRNAIEAIRTNDALRAEMSEKAAQKGASLSIAKRAEGIHNWIVGKM